MSYADMDVPSKIKHLRHNLRDFDDAYYKSGKPLIPDHEYDIMVKELEALELQYPEHASQDSPTQTVGSDLTRGFKQVTHPKPMYSLANTYSMEDVEAFVNRVDDRLTSPVPMFYVIEPKIDGLSVTIRYEKGILVRAVTRGDGKVGDDVTANVMTIKSIPKVLPIRKPPAVFEACGEVFIDHTDFQSINVVRVFNEEEPFSNPRNAASGSLKLLDPRKVAKRKLSAIFYGVGEVVGVDIPSQRDLLSLLKAYGIPTHDVYYVVEAIADEVWEAIDKIRTYCSTLNYDTDGAVVKLDDMEQRLRVGYTAKAPSWAMAYKYAETTTTTKILDITIQVGRSGVLTPVAELKPVPLCGSVISRATLHNEYYIERLGVRVGDTVTIKKAGEVIPAVVGVQSHEKNSKPFDLAQHVNGKCPACGSELIIRGPGAAPTWFCCNSKCCGRLVQQLLYFCSRPALDIQMVGEVTARALVGQGLVQDPLDLFRIGEPTFANLNLGTPSEPRLFGSSNARQLMLALDKARTAPLARWICAIGIPDVGVTIAEKLARCHSTMTDLATSSKLDKMWQFYRASDARPSKSKDREGWDAHTKIMHDLADEVKAIGLARPSVRNPDVWLLTFGEIVICSIRNFFQSDSGKQFLDKLSALHIDPKGTSVATTNLPLAGMTFVITGGLDSMDRMTAIARLHSMGATVSNTVTKGTTAVILGTDPGFTKQTKAKQLNIPCITEQEFLVRIGADQQKGP